MGLGAHHNRLIDTLLLNTHSICFGQMQAVENLILNKLHSLSLDLIIYIYNWFDASFNYITDFVASAHKRHRPAGASSLCRKYQNLS